MSKGAPHVCVCVCVRPESGSVMPSISCALDAPFAALAALCLFPPFVCSAVIPDGSIVLVAGRGARAAYAGAFRDQNSYPALNASLSAPTALHFIQNDYGGRLLFIDTTTSGGLKLRNIMCAPTCPGGQVRAATRRVPLREAVAVYRVTRRACPRRIFESAARVPAPHTHRLCRSAMTRVTSLTAAQVGRRPAATACACR